MNENHPRFGFLQVEVKRVNIGNKIQNLACCFHAGKTAANHDKS
jgi:hypothetical protein